MENPDASMLIQQGWCHAILLFLIMVCAGILGGIASYYLNESDDKSMVKSITLGIVAAFIVPVFLSMISSELIENSKRHVKDLFTFAGFCVLGAVFSRNFLENVYSKVLQQVGSISHKVKQIEEASEEVDIPEVADEELTATLQRNGLTIDEYRLLKGISGGRFTYRSLSGLQKDTGMDRGLVDQLLNQLLSKGLIDSRVNQKKQNRYFLSANGRKVLGSISDT